MDLEGGMQLETYNAAVDSLVTSMFGYDRSISEIVRHAYTNWQSVSVADPIELRHQFINVSIFFLISYPLSVLSYNQLQSPPCFIYLFLVLV